MGLGMGRGAWAGIRGAAEVCPRCRAPLPSDRGALLGAGGYGALALMTPLGTVVERSASSGSASDSPRSVLDRRPGDGRSPVPDGNDGHPDIAVSAEGKPREPRQRDGAYWYGVDVQKAHVPMLADPTLPGR